MSDLYQSCCPLHLPNLADDGSLDKILNEIAADLFNQKMAEGYIQPDLYKLNADKLLQALDGLGGSTFEYGDPMNEMRAYMMQNLYTFSAAKSLAELKEFNSYLINSDGSTADFYKFRGRVLDAGKVFNNQHLQTEFTTAEMSAIHARKWVELSATNEYLEFSTVGDDRVRPAHAALDGMTLPVSSPVWRTMWPPLDWNCRCTVIPGIAANAKYTDAQAGKMSKAVIPPLFRNNAGITKTIFDTAGNPYQVAIGKQKVWTAEKNYGLRSPEKIFTDGGLPIPKHLDTEADYRRWWHDQEKVPGTDDIVLQDTKGAKVLFESGVGKNSYEANYFKEHIIQNITAERGNRHEYAANFPDVFTKADEIWSNKENGRLVMYHIKYFDDGNAYGVVSHDVKGKLVAKSFYKLEPVTIDKWRTGTLIHNGK